MTWPQNQGGKKLVPFGAAWVQAQGLSIDVILLFPHGTCPVQEPDQGTGSVKICQVCVTNMGLGPAELISSFGVVALNVWLSQSELAGPRAGMRRFLSPPAPWRQDVV